MNFWKDKRAVVTGGAGFLGSFVVEKLRQRGCQQIFIPRSRDFEIESDTSQPDGQPRRCLDTSRAEREFGFKAKTNLREGLRSTIDWYESTRASHAVQAADSFGI